VVREEIHNALHVLYDPRGLRLEQVTLPLWLPVSGNSSGGGDYLWHRSEEYGVRGGHAKMLRPPTLFGHGAAGRIVAVGKMWRSWQVGDQVVANNSACMNAFLSTSGIFSLTWHGITAHLQNTWKFRPDCTQHNLLAISFNNSEWIGSNNETMACVLHGVARSNVVRALCVVVLGDGAIGLMFVEYWLTNPAKMLLFRGQWRATAN